MLGLLGQRWALRGEAQALTGPPAPRLPEAVGRRLGGQGSARPRLLAGQEAGTRGGRRGRAGNVCIPHAFSRDEPEFFLHEAPGGRGCGLRGSSRPCAVVDWVVRSPQAPGRPGRAGGPAHRQSVLEPLAQRRPHLDTCGPAGHGASLQTPANSRASRGPGSVAGAADGAVGARRGGAGTHTGTPPPVPSSAG